MPGSISGLELIDAAARSPAEPADHPGDRLRPTRRTCRRRSIAAPPASSRSRSRLPSCARRSDGDQPDVLGGGRAAGAVARADRRKRARERDRGTRRGHGGSHGASRRVGARDRPPAGIVRAGSGGARARGRPPRRRQDRHPRRHPDEAGAADRRGANGDGGAPGDRRPACWPRSRFWSRYGRSCATTTSAGTATGYPDRSSAMEIPLLARIVAVADSIEAMSGAAAVPAARSGATTSTRARARPRAPVGSGARRHRARPDRPRPAALRLRRHEPADDVRATRRSGVVGRSQLAAARLFLPAGRPVRGCRRLRRALRRDPDERDGTARGRGRRPVRGARRPASSSTAISPLSRRRPSSSRRTRRSRRCSPIPPPAR